MALVPMMPNFVVRSETLDAYCLTVLRSVTGWCSMSICGREGWVGWLLTTCYWCTAIRAMAGAHPNAPPTDCIAQMCGQQL